VAPTLPVEVLNEIRSQEPPGASDLLAWQCPVTNKSEDGLGAHAQKSGRLVGCQHFPGVHDSPLPGRNVLHPPANGSLTTPYDR
jgi:hypothetical protein